MEKKLSTTPKLLTRTENPNDFAHEWFLALDNFLSNGSEMDDIKAAAIADGTFMKAPNGADTNLSEEQWLMVRTENFKRWFGDWEKPIIANQIKALMPVDVSEYSIKDTPEKDYMSIGEVTNASDGIKVKFDHDAFKKGYKEGGKFEAAVPALGDMKNPSLMLRDPYQATGRGWSMEGFPTQR